MKRKANYTVAADAVADWKDSLLSGKGPVIYTVGTGTLARIELGPGRVVMMGGLPGGGKTALAMQLVIDALRATPTLKAVVANIEMDPTVLLDRQLARLSGVPLDLVARRQLDGSHADRIDRGLATLESIADRLAFVGPPYDLGNIAAAADDFDGQFLVLDYLQRIRPPGDHADRRGSVDALMDYIRQFADASCAVLCVSAVARSKDKRGRSSYDGDALSLASFRESSELEYGCDSAFVLVPDEESNRVTIRALKNRYGEPIDIELHFEKSLQRFTPTGPMPLNRQSGPKLAELSALWNRTEPAPEEDGRK